VIDHTNVAVKTLLVQGKRDKARFALMRRKLYERQLSDALGYLASTERLLLDVQSAQTSSRVHQAMRDGAGMMRRIMDAVRVEDVERVMEESAEARGWCAEVAGLMAGEFSAEQEADVAEELELLAEEVALDRAADMPSVPVGPAPVPAEAVREGGREADLPSAPTHVPRAKAAAREEERVPLPA